jgi:chromosome segregation ATPase
VSNFTRELELENAALRHSEENLASTVRGLEFELEKAQKKVVALRGKVEQLERAILRYAHIEETLASTVRGLEFELEKKQKQIDGLYAELASTGAEEVRQTRAENHQISQKASKLCYDLIARERELEKANAALDWLNTHCMSADPIMGRSTYRWTIEHDEPDIRAAIAELRKAQV